MTHKITQYDENGDDCMVVYTSNPFSCPKTCPEGHSFQLERNVVVPEKPKRKSVVDQLMERIDALERRNNE